MNILTLLIFIPLLFGAIIAVIPSSWRRSFRYITLLATLVQLAISVYIYLNFKTGHDFAGIANEAQYQFVQKLPWINLNLGSLGIMQIDYFVGIDGISLPMLVMTSLVLVIAAIASWEIKSNIKGFFILFLIFVFSHGMKNSELISDNYYQDELTYQDVIDAKTNADLQGCYESSDAEVSGRSGCRNIVCRIFDEPAALAIVVAGGRACGRHP